MHLEEFDELRLGHDAMDDEHEEFVRLVAALRSAPDDALPGPLNALAAHAASHFAHENAWMEGSGFPARACHIDEHAAVLRSLDGVRGRLAQGDLTVVRRLVAELESWFPAHAQHLDSALAHWLCKQRLGGKPIVIRRKPQVETDHAF